MMMTFKTSRDLPELSFLVGKIGSGKSTFSRNFKGSGVIVLNADEIMKPLFGQTLGRERYIKNLSICSEFLFSIADQILDSGIKVILDFGFWEKETRNQLRKRFSERDYKFLYLEISDEEQWRRIQSRNLSEGSSYPFQRDDLRRLNGFFDNPLKDDIDDILVVREFPNLPDRQ